MTKLIGLPVLSGILLFVITMFTESIWATSCSQVLKNLGYCECSINANGQLTGTKRCNPEERTPTNVTFAWPMYTELDEVNTDQYAATVNYLHNGTIYRFRIVNGILEEKVGDYDWAKIKNGNPKNTDGTEMIVLNIAADNNRVCVIAKNNEGVKSIWWCSMVYDVASWSKFLIDVGGWAIKTGYSDWTNKAHSGSYNWINVSELRDDKIDVNEIVDIAVGNWSQTVVTYYALLKNGEIKYVDEEPVMSKWYTVPRVSNPANSPFPLGQDARIDASNSVITVIKPGSTGTKIHWIRWDFHNPKDFTYWPNLNWCENGWHVVDCPVTGKITGFRIDTHYYKDGARGETWTRPDAAWGADFGGFLGSMDRNVIDEYPVKMYVRDMAGSMHYFKIDRSYNEPGWEKDNTIAWNDKWRKGMQGVMSLLLD